MYTLHTILKDFQDDFIKLYPIFGFIKPCALLFSFVEMNSLYGAEWFRQLFDRIAEYKTYWMKIGVQLFVGQAERKRSNRWRCRLSRGRVDASLWLFKPLGFPLAIKPLVELRLKTLDILNLTFYKVCI